MNIKKTLLTFSLLTISMSSYGISFDEILNFFNEDKNQQETTTSDALSQLAGSENSSVDETLTNLSRPGSERIVEPKTEREIAIEKEYDAEVRQTYLAVLKDPGFKNLITNNGQIMRHEKIRIEEGLALIEPLEKALQPDANEETIEKGFPSFKQLNFMLEKMTQEQEKYTMDFIRNNKEALKCLQDLQERAAHREKLLTSKKPNLAQLANAWGKNLETSVNKKKQIEQARYERYQARNAARKS